MKFARFILLGLLLCAATSFAEPLPVPASKAAYIGKWVGKDMELQIAANGKIAYRRVYSAQKKVNLDIELASFHGDSFDAGFAGIHSTFNVTTPPTTTAGITRMVLDGVELTKAN